MRTYPRKREHLLNQIREQAKQIQELMAKVEALNRPAAEQSPHSPGSTIHSTMESNSESVVPNAEMQDWISKARVSIQEFGGLIPAGDPTDADDPYLSDEAEEYSDDESGYATAEDDASRDVGSPASSVARRQPARTAPLKMLPGEDTPYGLMAALAIRKNAREKSVEPESSEAVGVASADFFRPSMYVSVLHSDSDTKITRSGTRSQTHEPIYGWSSSASYIGSRDRLDQGSGKVVRYVGSHPLTFPLVLTLASLVTSKR